MAHCPFELLKDLEPCLSKIRALPKIKETKPGIFYLKGRSFLHFHINKENRRWADVVDGKSWGAEIDVPFNSSQKKIKEFIQEVERRHQRSLGQ